MKKMMMRLFPRVKRTVVRPLVCSCVEYDEETETPEDAVPTECCYGWCWGDRK